MKAGVLAFALCVGCGTSAERTTTPTPPDEAIGADEEVDQVDPPSADEAGPDTLFAAQVAALESQDAAAFTQDFADEAIFVGPVADALYVGRQAVNTHLGDVIDATGTVSVSAAQVHHGEHVSVAWTVHDVEVAQSSEGEPLRFRTSTLYRRAESWTIVAQAWGVIVENTRYAALAQRAEAPAAVEGRADAACASPAQAVTAWLSGNVAVWDAPDVFAAGVDPSETRVGTRSLANAEDALAVEAGPGGVRAIDLGESVCAVLNNQVVENKTEGAQPAGALPYRMLSVFVGDTLRLAHVLAVAPNAPREPDEDGEDGEEAGGDESGDAEEP